MKKKYQIFISSTYTDLIEEREIITRAILKMGHFPVGMEQFSASGESQWNIIQELIKTSDYYILIIKNNYGSIGENGISYTENEYNYAIEKNIPILAYLINEDIYPKSKILNIRKLKAFKRRVMESNIQVEWWNSKEELVNRLLTSLYKVLPISKRPGWIRGAESCSEILSNDAIIKSSSKDFIVITGKDILNNECAELFVEMDSQGTKGHFMIGLDYPCYYSITGSINNVGISFANEFSSVSLCDESGEILPDIKLQILCIDLDNDGMKEVVIAAGEGIFGVEEIIIYSIVLGARNPFEYVGHICTGGDCIIEPQTNIIQTICGSAHIMEAYIYRYKHIWKVADEFKDSPE